MNQTTNNFFFWLGEDGLLDFLTQEGFSERINRERQKASEKRDAEDLERN